MKIKHNLKTASVEIACDCRCELAEGPVWHNGALYWVDIVSGDFYRQSENSITRKHVGGLLGAVVPAGGENWLLARNDGFALFNWSTGAIKLLDNPEAHLTGNRFNDAKCDPQGRFWAGTMNLEGKKNAASLYMLDQTLVSRKMLGDVSLSNGLGWSPDGQSFYYIDTPTRKIDVFAFDSSSGSLSNRRTLHEFTPEEGFPDGLTVDALGNLWVALWGGHAVKCIDGLSGEEKAHIPMPVSQPSSCTFGGVNMDTLFITSAWQDLTPEQWALDPLAGHIFRIQPGVQGLPVKPFSLPDFDF